MFKETKKKVTPQNSLILNCMELNLFLLVRTIINNVNIKITKKKNNKNDSCSKYLIHC